jgi:hypothetical protein
MGRRGDNGSEAPEQLVFVLGCQRSGTTWLSNILDASPHTLLFMEPFEPPAGFFPEFPDSSYFLESWSPHLDHVLRFQMRPLLYRHKYLVLSESLSDPRQFGLERALAKLGTRVRRFLPHRLQRRIRRFVTLNLNRMDGSYPVYPKNSRPSTWVIKEVRLAGKIPLLLHAFPRAHFLVIMRHPCATVLSILRWFERGRLGELRQDVATFLEKLEAQRAGEAYRDLIQRCRTGGLAETLALYWRVSYETMFRRLTDHPLAHFIVYEELATQPKETAMRIVADLGIPWSHSISQYVSYSTSTRVDKPGPLNTARQSATYFSAWAEEISPDTLHAVLEVAGDSFLARCFEPYYADTPTVTGRR